MRSFPMIFLMVLCLAISAGCVGSGTSNGGTPSVQGDASQCTEVYTYAPAAYVIHIVSGDAVILDPAANNFQVFCDVNSANKGLQNALNTGAVPSGDWKIYRVYGTWAEVTTEVESGVFLLNRAVPLVDWVS